MTPPNNKQPKTIKVLIGQVSLTRAPNILQSVLGSCIGVCIYDSVTSTAGMAHVLLPDSTDRPVSDLPGKYADLAVPCIYNALIKLGCNPANFKAKIAGGARMFESSNSYAQKDVGSLNAHAVKRALEVLKVPLVGEDTGGGGGRKVEMELFKFSLKVEDFAKCQKVI